MSPSLWGGDSVRGNDYPQEKLVVFVAAHNCTDRTAQIARAHGASVYGYGNPAERTAGHACRYLFDRINAGWGTLDLTAFSSSTPTTFLPLTRSPK